MLKICDGKDSHTSSTNISPFGKLLVVTMMPYVAAGFTKLVWGVAHAAAGWRWPVWHTLSAVKRPRLRLVWVVALTFALASIKVGVIAPLTPPKSPDQDLMHGTLANALADTTATTLSTVTRTSTVIVTTAPICTTTLVADILTGGSSGETVIHVHDQDHVHVHGNTRRALNNVHDELMLPTPAQLHRFVTHEACLLHAPTHTDPCNIPLSFSPPGPQSLYAILGIKPSTRLRLALLPRNSTTIAWTIESALLQVQDRAVSRAGSERRYVAANILLDIEAKEIYDDVFAEGLRIEAEGKNGRDGSRMESDENEWDDSRDGQDEEVAMARAFARPCRDLVEKRRGTAGRRDSKV